MPQRLADSLRTLRRDAGLTQVQMAKALGISQPTLNRLESATQNATLRTLGHICKVLNCEPGDLFREGALKLGARKRRFKR